MRFELDEMYLYLRVFKSIQVASIQEHPSLAGCVCIDATCIDLKTLNSYRSSLGGFAAGSGTGANGVAGKAGGGFDTIAEEE